MGIFDDVSLLKRLPQDIRIGELTGYTFIDLKPAHGRRGLRRRKAITLWDMCPLTRSGVTLTTYGFD
jgi:hypothetical protein